ncbi:uncharacterized protein [Temnothorax longispinosus]|uniref:uncharacterized protein n=1 Tax=Temnothorax longispinosus TaxID=300112 RepID=UPI003A9A0813
MELTDKGYETAWSELILRYDNRRVLLSTHMRVFLSSPAMARPSSADLKQIISVALQTRRSFESLGRPVAHWDDWFVHVIVEKLDFQSRLFWEASLQTSSKFPTFRQLQDFLQTRVRALDAANPKGSAAPATTAAKQDRKAKVNALTASAPGTAGSNRRCSLCQGNHLFGYCPRFKEMPVPQRRECVKKQGACFNCLRTKHLVSSCLSAVRCLRCQEKHHTLLHLTDASVTAKPVEKGALNPAVSAKEAPPSAAVATNVAALAAASGRSVLLATAQATFKNKTGDSVIARVLLDSGSEASFLSDRVARALRLPRRRVHVPVSGLQGATSGVSTHAVSVTLGSPHAPEVCLYLPEMLLLPKLTSVLPQQPVIRQDWPHILGLTLRATTSQRQWTRS